LAPRQRIGTCIHGVKTGRRRLCFVFRWQTTVEFVDVRLDCRKAVKFGDTIEIASRVAEFRRSSFNVDHRITIDGELAVAGSETRHLGGAR
jgi:acyl-CoA thioesterase FadM